MKQKELEKIQAEYKRIFGNVWEKGGGWGYRYKHGVRVMRYCQKIVKYNRFKKEKLDIEALLVAALFHDIGKIRAVNKNRELVYGNYGGETHEALGAKLAPKYLRKFIKDKNKLELISLFIAEQEPEKSEIRTESKIIKDADRLDHFGVIHLLVSAVYANYNRKNIEGLREFWEGEEGKKKYLRNFEKFNFPEVKKVAMKRFANLSRATELIFEEDEGRDL